METSPGWLTAERLARDHSKMRSPKTLGTTLAAALALVLTFAPQRSSAAPPGAATAEQRETARFFMAEGRQLREKNDLKGALEKFKAADALVHAPTSALEVARTYAALGLLVEARDTALAIVRSPVQPNEPVPFRTARITAARLSDELAVSIPTLQIDAIDGETALVPQLTKVDDAEMATAPGVHHVERRVNPGTHTVFARAGDLEGSTWVDVAAGETKRVVVPVRLVATPLKTPPPVSKAPPGPAAGHGEPAPARSGIIGSNAVTYAAFGVAGAGVALGAVTGIMALGRASDARSGCQGSTCLASTSVDFDAAHTFATVSTVSFIVGGVAAAIGVANIFLAPSRANGAGIGAFVGPGRFGVEGAF